MIYLDDNIHEAFEKVAGVRSTLSRVIKGKLRIRKGKTLKNAQKLTEARIKVGLIGPRSATPRAISRFRKRTIY